MNVNDKELTPFEQIDAVIKQFRITLKEYAGDFVLYPVRDGVPYEEALNRYMAIIQDTDDYNTWRKHLKAIVDDCARDYRMERWWVRSCMNFNLDKEVRLGFKAAWDELNPK